MAKSADDTTVPGTDILVTLPRVIMVVAPVATALAAYQDDFQKLDVAVQLTLLIGTFSLAGLLLFCYAWLKVAKARPPRA